MSPAGRADGRMRAAAVGPQQVRERMPQRQGHRMGAAQTQQQAQHRPQQREQPREPGPVRGSGPAFRAFPPRPPGDPPRRRVGVRDGLEEVSTGGHGFQYRNKILIFNATLDRWFWPGDARSTGICSDIRI